MTTPTARTEMDKLKNKYLKCKNKLDLVTEKYENLTKTVVRENELKLTETIWRGSK